MAARPQPRLPAPLPTTTARSPPFTSPAPSTASTSTACPERSAPSQGFLGLDPDVRPGYEQIRVTIKATGDFDDNQLAELASLTRYSPVRDIVSNPVPVAIDVARA